MNGKKVVLLAVGNDYSRDEWALLVTPPLGILALGSYLVAHDMPAELIDVQMDFGFGLTHDIEHTVSQRVARYLHDHADAISWVGISQLSNTSMGVRLAQEIHTGLPDIPIIFGGYFPSANYRLLLQKYPFITAIVRGDGEAAALQISRSLNQGWHFLSNKTPNLAWLDEGDIHTTPIQPVALDNLPILNFRLLRNKTCYQIVSIMTTRGCPFHCNYCLESNMRPYAVYPIDWVARQLAHIEAELPNRRVGITDPIFGLSRTRTLEMCQVMREHRFTYVVGSRVDALTPDLIQPLRQAGVEVIFWGIESASPATLLCMNKVRSATKARIYLENALEVLKACFENNVMPLLGFMLGFPSDLEADLQATLEFVKEVSQLHDQITAQTGVKTGCIPAPQFTKIYAGSPLAERVEIDFPKVILRSEPFEWERGILSPSPGLGLDVIDRYRAEIESLGNYTPQALELKEHCFGFSSQDLIASHPKLTDDQGVTKLCDSVRLLSK